MNKRGQALIEFVVVLPILLFILSGMIDFGNVLYHKYKLENELDYVTSLYEKGETSAISHHAYKLGATFHSDSESNWVTLKLQKNIKVITPGLNLALGNPHQIIVERVIYAEQ